MNIVLLTLTIITGLFLVILVFIQSGKVRTSGASITGTQDLELFENRKIRGSEKWLNITTWLMVALFMIFTIVLFVT